MAPVPNQLLLAARAQRKSPTGSGRMMSRQEVVDELNLHLRRPIDGKHYGRIERGEIRWPGRDLRDALRRLFGARTDSELGLFIVRGQPSVADDRALEAVRAEPAGVRTADRRLLWRLAAQRNWQTPATFRVHFERAVVDLAEREADPVLRGLSVSDRQVRRWLDGGTQPRPAACRVLEFMFGHPIGRLFARVESEPDIALADERIATALSRGEDWPLPATVRPDGAPASVAQIEVNLSPGTAVTISCDEGGTAGTVRILICATAAAASQQACSMTTGTTSRVAGDAQVLSIAQRTARRSTDGRRKPT